MVKVFLILLFSFVLINCTKNINIYDSEGKMYADFNRTAETDFKVANVFIRRGNFKDAEQRYYEILNSKDKINYKEEHKEEALYRLGEFYLIDNNPLKNIEKSTSLRIDLLRLYPNTKYNKSE